MVTGSMVLQSIFIGKLRITVNHCEALGLTCDSEYEPQRALELFRVLAILRSSPALTQWILAWLLCGHVR